MALIMNCLEDENRVTVGGTTFTFSPKQIKYFHNAEIAHHIARLKGAQGFVDLPEELEYLGQLRKGERPEDVVQPEHKEIIDSKRKEGIDNYCKHLNALVYNAQVSLDRDLKRADYKHDAKYEYSEGDIKNMELLLKYQGKKADDSKKRVDRAKDLEKALEASKG